MHKLRWKKPRAGRYPHGAKGAPGRIVVRQRSVALRSKVVTTEMQLDINVERLLLNRGTGRNSDLATDVRRLK
jgi:hypothetical protein